MKTKVASSKTRIKVNTCILVVLSILIGLMTFLGVKRLESYRLNLIGVSDAPGLCFDEEKYKNELIEDAYPCTTDGEPVSSDNENVIFLFNRANFASTMEINGMLLVLITIGSILTVSSLVVAVVYWNHNR